MKIAASLIGLLLSATTPAAGQVQPFDMSPERSAEPVAVPDPAAPLVAPTLPAADPAEPVRRYLVPFTEMVLAGEYARRSWSIYLTPEQAASGARLNFGYQNAVVIAPEISRLRLSINGTRLIETPVASPDNISGVSAEVPAGLLHAGMNDIVLEASQRHRTDCTIESTYELWTQVELAETYLAFDSPEAGHWKRVDDIRAIGVDATGATRFNIVAPSMQQAGAAGPVVKLGQSLALMANMPSQSFSVSEDGTPAPGAGQANVVLGVASELSDVLSEVPAGAQSAPTVALVDDARLGSSTLVVTGPTWQAVEAAVGDLGQQVDRPVGVQRAYLSTRPWHTPDVPMLRGVARLKFSDLGLGTLEFSGRRMRTEFAVGVPADFYATAYGEATILLDAAYAQDVLPGSHIDIYVNDNIAATVPITASGGEMLRHLPIKVTMRHFLPGKNVIGVEAVLLTQADAVCAPGATGLDTGRFVLFDSSEFVMPDYARIGRTPELSALGGTAFPYNVTGYPVPLFLDRTQPETLSAATTLMARMAVSAGRLIPVDTNASVASSADRNAIFLSTISQVPPAVLSQIGIAERSRSSWGETVASVRPDTQSTFDEWRERLQGSGWRGQVGRFQEWMNRTFNVSMDTFRIFRPDEPAFEPGGNARLLIAMDPNPAGTGVWTLFAAPTMQELKDGINGLTGGAQWQQLGGHITTISPTTDDVSRIPAGQTAFIETQPFSLKNYRLIAANWLSMNALSYGLAITIMAIILGLATGGVLGTFGRRNR